MEVITTKRGSKKICLDGFMYTVKSQSKRVDEVSWRCVKRDPPAKCNAMLKTNKACENPVLVKQHCHPADEVAVSVAQCRHTMKVVATTTNDKPNQILTFSTAALPDEVKARLPSADTSKRPLRRARAQHRPKDPQSLQELNISDEWAATIGDNPTRFLLYDNGPEADERVIIFATQQHLQKLAECTTWCMDGTFSVAPRIFHQLYVIQGHVNGVFMPLVFALLQRKTQTTYEEMLRVLDEAGCDPATVIVDFERSVELSIHSVFGAQVNIQYCFYHLTQSIWRKIQELGLTNLYEGDTDFRLFCGRLDALAFLPPDEVREGMTHLKDIMPDEAEPLVEYFDTTYVTGQLRQRRVPQGDGIPRLQFRRLPPMFDPASWNMHEITLADQPRTNNVSEGWNNKFHGFVGHDHPTVWKLIECLQAECARVTTTLLQDERGIRPKKRVKKVYTELQTRLRNLCQDRVEGRKAIQEFLRGVSHNLRGGQPNI